MSENARRMYSAGYQEGQRLAHVPRVMARVDADAAAYDSEPRYVRLDTPFWTAGFRDGWHGRVPAHALRLADIEL